LFDRENADFISLYKSKRPDKKNLNLIFEGSIGQVGSCTTDVNGVCNVGVNSSGKFLMIAKYLDGTYSVYTGKYQNFKRATAASDEEDDMDTDAKNVTMPILQKKLHFIKTIGKDGTVKYDAGIISIFTGSELSVLYPEYTIWDGSSTLYPFVMTSDSNWAVDVCMQVPTGYSLKGVQDASGNIIGISNCTQALVAGQPAIVLFSIADIGSPEPSMGLSLTTTHNGKKANKNIIIDGIRKKTKDAQDQALKAQIDKKAKSLQSKSAAGKKQSEKMFFVMGKEQLEERARDNLPVRK
jgi:hypothetical protein